MYSVDYNDIFHQIFCIGPGNLFYIQKTVLKYQYLTRPSEL